MKKAAVFVTVLVLAMATGISLAGTADPGIQDRIENQQERIDQGIVSGELTKGEAVRLQGNLNRIRSEEALMKEDGRLTPRERVRLNRDLDASSKRIYHKKHNPRRR